jgi:hypothetical protein
LIVNVLLAWEAYPPKTLDKVWISHQACMNEIMQCRGGNHYKVPHVAKHTLVDEKGVLPHAINVTTEASESLTEMGFHSMTYQGMNWSEKELVRLNKKLLKQKKNYLTGFFVFGFFI